MSPRGAAGRSLGAPFRSSKLCTATGFGSCSLSLVSTEQFGTDRTFPSPDFVELQTVNGWKSQALLSGRHPCGSSADQLPANPLVPHEGVGWALPEWERGVHSPWGCCALARHGRGWMDRSTVSYTLHWPQHERRPRSAPAACGAGAALPACAHGQSSHFLLLFGFPIFPAHFTGLKFNLQTLSHAQLSLQKCGAYRPSTC